jgi:hypothetical protein
MLFLFFDPLVDVGTTASSLARTTSLNSVARQSGSLDAQNLHVTSSGFPEHCNCHRATHLACAHRGHAHG